MAPSLTESGSPKHPSSKDVTGIEKKETQESGTSESCDLSFDVDTKTESAETTNRSGVRLESSSESDAEVIYPLRIGYRLKLIR